MKFVFNDFTLVFSTK